MQMSPDAGYAELQRIKSSLPTDGRLRYNNFGKGVMFWETNTEARRYVNAVDLVSNDIYWFTDPNVCGSGEGGRLLAGGIRALPQANAAAQRTTATPSTACAHSSARAALEPDLELHRSRPPLHRRRRADHHRPPDPRRRLAQPDRRRPRHPVLQPQLRRPLPIANTSCATPAAARSARPSKPTTNITRLAPVLNAPADGLARPPPPSAPWPNTRPASSTSSPPTKTTPPPAPPSRTLHRQRHRHRHRRRPHHPHHQRDRATPSPTATPSTSTASTAGRRCGL